MVAPQANLDTSIDQAKSPVKKILVVDDHRDNRLLAGLMLEILGYEHEAVDGGLEALNYITKTHYDAVLMDIQMPDLDGLETARRMRAFEKEHKLAPIPIIAVTAHAARIFEDECLKAGMNGFILKPYTSNELVRMINRTSNTN